jgi:hypothetical protein
MLKNILSLFLLSSLLFSVLIESSGHYSPLESEEVTSSVPSGSLFAFEDSCKKNHERSHENHQEHCSYLCHVTLGFPIGVNSSSCKKLREYAKKVPSYKDGFYQNPILDPALKPPTAS